MSEFGEDVDWEVLPSPKSYYPTRLEYFAGKALEGLLVGRALKDHPGCVRDAVAIAHLMEQAIDSAQG